MEKLLKKDIVRIILVVLASFVMALNIKSFVRAGNLFPGGFNGLTILVQQIGLKYWQVEVPFSLVNLMLNLVPIVISFRFIGKKFTLYSCLMIVLTSVLTDILPGYPITSDILLICVFGGIINGCAISLCLFAGATSGGTDFIAIAASEKRGVDAWNYIFMGNVVILLAAGILFGWDKALYSIVFQFASTQVLNALYKRYQKHTLFIITEHPDEVYHEIALCTHHDATLFHGVGCFEQKQRHMLYSVVSSEQVKKVIAKTRQVDPAAFINLVKTEQVSGRFYRRPND